MRGAWLLTVVALGAGCHGKSTVVGPAEPPVTETPSSASSDEPIWHEHRGVIGRGVAIHETGPIALFGQSRPQTSKDPLAIAGWVAVYDPAGKPLWSAEVDRGTTWATDVALRIDGAATVEGFSLEPAGRWVRSYSALGVLRWHFGVPPELTVAHVDVRPDVAVVVLEPGEDSDADVIVIELESDGSERARTEVDAGFGVSLDRVVPASGGGYLLGKKRPPVLTRAEGTWVIQRAKDRGDPEPAPGVGQTKIVPVEIGERDTAELPEGRALYWEQGIGADDGDTVLGIAVAQDIAVAKAWASNRPTPRMQVGDIADVTAATGRRAWSWWGRARTHGRWATALQAAPHTARAMVRYLVEDAPRCEAELIEQGCDGDEIEWVEPRSDEDPCNFAAWITPAIATLEADDFGLEGESWLEVLELMQHYDGDEKVLTALFERAAQVGALERFVPTLLARSSDPLYSLLLTQLDAHDTPDAKAARAAAAARLRLTPKGCRRFADVAKPMPPLSRETASPCELLFEACLSRLKFRDLLPRSGRVLEIVKCEDGFDEYADEEMYGSCEPSHRGRKPSPMTLDASMVAGCDGSIATSPDYSGEGNCGVTERFDQTTVRFARQRDGSFAIVEIETETSLEAP